jgi:hypothetical protein
VGEEVKILFSTTLGHNPGDEIIHAGVHNLLRHGLKLDFESLFYNRNPDLQFGHWREPIQDPIGNYYTLPVDLSFVDKVVLSGSPEFFSYPMKGLYEALEKRPDIPMYSLGVGLGERNAPLGPLSRKILSTYGSKIITRSNETADWLNQNGVFGVKAMVCPALFSSMYSTDPVHNETLYIVQRPGTGWHEIKASLLDGLEKTDQLLCLHLKEFHYFKSQGFERVSYAASGAEALRIIGRYERVVSTRLHGAIGALSCGRPAIAVSDGDFRIETCARMLDSKLAGARSVREANGVVDNGCILPCKEFILDWKWEQWNKWVEVLKEIW